MGIRIRYCHAIGLVLPLSATFKLKRVLGSSYSQFTNATGSGFGLFENPELSRPLILWFQKKAPQEEDVLSLS